MIENGFLVQIEKIYMGETLTEVEALREKKVDIARM